MTHSRRVSKAIPLWDGDGVQGAGQPRDRAGRWVGLPGPTSLTNIGIFQNSDGDWEVRATTDIGAEARARKESSEQVLRTYKSKSAANKFVAGKIKEDAEEYKKGQRSASARAGAARRRIAQADASRLAESENARRQHEEIFGPQKPGKVVESLYDPSKTPAKGRRGPNVVGGKKPHRKVTPVRYGEMERIPNPGHPSLAEQATGSAWAKQNLPDKERKYAELIQRLLVKRKTTQDPAKRKEMSEKYGIPAKRLIEIEQGVYDAMFPPAQKKKVVPKHEQSGLVSPGQAKAMSDLGVRNSFPESDPSSFDRPTRYAKINKGPSKGKYAKISWNGSVDIVDESEVNSEKTKSKVSWTQRLLSVSNFAQKRRDRYKAEQNAKREAAGDTPEMKLKRKVEKIRQAQAWAEKEGLDKHDSYWWALYWNDPTMISGATESGLGTHFGYSELFMALANGDEDEYFRYAQDVATSTPIDVALSERVNSHQMDPGLLEGLLSLPDISSRDIRGFRPDSPKARKEDEDFEEASPESREDSPEWKARRTDIHIKHDRRALNREYRQYLKEHPNSKMTFDYWKKRVKKITKAVQLRCSGCGELYFTDDMGNPKHEGKLHDHYTVKKSNVFWDGDGVQGRGQPRDNEGKWSRLPGKSALQKIGVWELDDGSWGVFEDGKQTPSKTYGTKRQAMLHASRAVEADKVTATSPRRSGGAAKRHGGVAAMFNDAKKVVAGKVKRPQKGSEHQKVAGEKRIPVRMGKKQYTPEQALYLRNNGETGISTARLAQLLDKKGKPITPLEFDLIMAAAPDKEYDGTAMAKRTNAKGKPTLNSRGSMIDSLRYSLTQKFHKDHGIAQVKNVKQNEKDRVKRAANLRHNWQYPWQLKVLLDNFGDGRKTNCIICGDPVFMLDLSPERMKPEKAGGIYDNPNVAPAHKDCNIEGAANAQRYPQEYFMENLRWLKKRYPKAWADGRLNYIKKQYRKELRELGLL